MIRIFSFRRAEQALPPMIGRGALAPPTRVIRRDSRGFTLIELMITLVVAGILMMIAIPRFKTITLKHRLSTTANDYVDALHAAQMAAVKRNSNAQFCGNVASGNGSDVLGTQCGSGGGAVALLETPTSASTIQAPVTSVTVPLKLNGNVTAVRFDGMGIGYAVSSTTPYTGPVAVIYTDELSSGNCRVINMTGGTIITTTNTDPNYSGCK